MLIKKKYLYQLHRFPLSADSQQAVHVLWASVYITVLLFSLGLCWQILPQSRDGVVPHGILTRPIKDEVLVHAVLTVESF